MGKEGEERMRKFMRMGLVKVEENWYDIYRLRENQIMVFHYYTVGTKVLLLC